MLFSIVTSIEPLNTVFCFHLHRDSFIQLFDRIESHLIVISGVNFENRIALATVPIVLPFRRNYRQ